MRARRYQAGKAVDCNIRRYAEVADWLAIIGAQREQPIVGESASATEGGEHADSYDADETTAINRYHSAPVRLLCAATASSAA
jgi:isopropylmalate/homocitrate/citramalate synthase